MDEPTLRVFSHRVIRQVVQHLVGDDLVLEAQDYRVLRLVFRACGGNWEALILGDPHHLETLKKVVSAWGSMPNRKSEVL